MVKEEPRSKSTLSVYVYEPQCHGCVVCVRACPTKAIRIRNDKAMILPDLCVDCAECIRVCPQKAIIPRVSTYQDLARFKVTALLPSPVIYTQFGPEILPNEILLALTKRGFDYVFDLAKYCEWCNLAISAWLADHPEVRTAISPLCPVVAHLIAAKFPDLIPNLVPLAPPREFGARHVRRFLRRRLGLDDRDIGVFYVTPCPAKMVAIDQPLGLERSYLNGALGMHTVYGDVLKALKDLTDEDRETMIFQASGFGIDWGAGGLGLAENTLVVSGLSETLEVLEQVESGRLKGVRYIESRICPDGCLGGPLTVENRFLSRNTLRQLVQMFGAKPRARLKDITSLLEEGFCLTNREIKPNIFRLDPDPLEAMKKLKKVDQLTSRLPGKQCAVCGAPDCRTLAEDVVLGRADLFVCPLYFRLRTWGRRKMRLSEIVDKLELKVLTAPEALEREVNGVYASDLLSDVMANSKSGQLWVTLQGHVNVVAVAVLRELAGIVLVNNRTPAEDTAAKAVEENLPILQSDLPAFELCGRLYSLLAA